MITQHRAGYGIRVMSDTCRHCGELRESDGYCPDGCELYVGSVESVTGDTVSRELGEWWK